MIPFPLDPDLARANPPDLATLHSTGTIKFSPDSPAYTAVRSSCLKWQELRTATIFPVKSIR